MVGEVFVCGSGEKAFTARVTEYDVREGLHELDSTGLDIDTQNQFWFTKDVNLQELHLNGQLRHIPAREVVFTEEEDPHLLSHDKLLGTNIVGKIITLQNPKGTSTVTVTAFDKASGRHTIHHGFGRKTRADLNLYLHTGRLPTPPSLTTILARLRKRGAGQDFPQVPVRAGNASPEPAWSKPRGRADPL